MNTSRNWLLLLAALGICGALVFADKNATTTAAPTNATHTHQASHGNATAAETEENDLPKRNFTSITPEPCEKEVLTGKLLGVRIAANCTTGRCQLPSNSSVKVEIDFDPGENTDILIPKIYGMIGPVEIAFPGLRKNVCDSVKSVDGKSCPLKKGTAYTYRKEIPIKDEYPPIRVGVKWKFVTDHNTTSICFVIKSEIVDHDLQ